MDKKYICEKCQYGCNYLSEWNEHLLSKKHTGEKRKERSDKILEEQCKFCDYKPTKTTNLKLHYLNKHATKEDRVKEFKFYQFNFTHHPNLTLFILNNYYFCSFRRFLYIKI